MKKILLGFIAIGLLTFVGCDKGECFCIENETTDRTETSSDEESSEIPVLHCEKNNIIKFSSEEYIFIPNMYTPNGDYVCDQVVIKSNPKMTNLNFVLKNSEDEIVYETNQDSSIIYCTPYDGKQMFSKDEKFIFNLDCKLGSRSVSTSGTITLASNPMNSQNLDNYIPLSVKNCDSCFFSDLMFHNNLDTFKFDFSNEVIDCFN